MKSLLLTFLLVVATAFAAEPVSVNDFSEEKLDFPIASGPFEPTWDSINKNYGEWPAWFNQSKFGIWIHFGPQAAGRSGDWYAARMYMPTNGAYTNHLKNYGHPSEVGYKDVLNQRRLPKWKPEKWMQAFRDAGTELTIKSLGTDATLFDSGIKSVTLLGSKATLSWKQTADGLVIHYPKTSNLKMAVGFKIL